MTYDPNASAPTPRRGMGKGAKFAVYGCAIPAAVALLFLGGCAVLAGGAVHEVDKAVKADEKDDRRALKEDVQVTSCKITNGVLGRELKTAVKVTNHGTKRANYLIEGEFTDQKGRQVGSLTAAVENLAPGATSSPQEFGGVLITSDQLKGVTSGTCKILKVSRDEWSAAN